MIPYVEIRDKYTLKTIAAVEPQECWFELSYQEIGEFEIFCTASPKNLNALQKGRYVTLPNKRFIWVITAIKYTFTAGGARMISATGYEAKHLLTRRCILTPKELNGDIITEVYGLINDNIINPTITARKIEHFAIDTARPTLSETEAQATRGNLWEFVASLLKRHNLGSIVEFVGGALTYRVFAGEVKTHTVRFSQSLDNLLSSEYLSNDAEISTHALIVSTFEETEYEGETEKKYKVDYTQEVDEGKTGIDRAEIVIESNLSTKYEDANGNEIEITPDSELYKSWQREEGKKALAEKKTVEEIAGEVDIANTAYAFDDDFFIGDLVRIQDEFFNFASDVKITKYTLKQDANGYGEEAEYGG